MPTRWRRTFLAVEFALIYGIAPLLILALRDRGVMFAALWLAAIVIFIKTPRSPPLSRLIWRTEIRNILVRFALLAPLIALITWGAQPDLFLSFPRQQPLLWLTVMLLYPLLSVWPQEVLYRHFLFHRYAPLWGTGLGFVLVSAVSFGFMHVIFLNGVAVVMSALGGLIFANSYRQYRSLTLVCIEHALYGGLVFTLGLGRYFYSGAAWQ